MTASELRVRIWDSEQQAPADVPLRFAGGAATAEVQCLAGASGVHVVLSDASGVRLRAEVSAEPGEAVSLRVDVDEDGRPHLASGGRSVIHLPVDARYEPPLPIRSAHTQPPLDIVLVIDATMRSWSNTAPSEQEGRPVAVRLLERKDVWATHANKLVTFVERIAEGCDAHVAVLAFGDQDPPAVTAADLRPRYLLHPVVDERVLRAAGRVPLRDVLLAIPPTPGADFVDATADALAACAHLNWRHDTRKLVVLVGDSPGASLLHPLPKGADLCVRQLDVDTQAFRLYARGVELLTIYHAPPQEAGLDNLPVQRDLLLHARDQYERLASLRELAFRGTSFEPEVAADRFRAATGPIGRGAALGELLSAGQKPARSRSAKGR